MKIVAIADTHNLHRHFGKEPFGNIPGGDILIHAGDVTTHGTEEEVATFLDWFQLQPHRHKLWIAGNHDRCLERVNVVDRWHRPGIVYLEDTGITIHDVKFWGSPYTPDHQDFAFQLRQSANEKWSHIPSDVNVLITHGPPFGILDSGHGMDHAGCPVLLSEVIDRIKPKIHIFGHIHEGYGQHAESGTEFFNASVHTWLWKQSVIQHPHEFEVL